MSTTTTSSAQTDIKVEIQQAHKRWADALETENADTVVACYAPDALLLPTLVKDICKNHDQIRTYFKGLVARKTNVIVHECHIRTYGKIATSCGIYQFCLKDEKGENMTVDARFTFVHEKIDGEWLIKEHHSSTLPAASLPKS